MSLDGRADIFGDLAVDIFREQIPAFVAGNEFRFGVSVRHRYFPIDL
jgi:hypothetical protein